MTTNPTYPDERQDDKPTDATATGGLSPPDWETSEDFGGGHDEDYREEEPQYDERPNGHPGWDRPLEWARRNLKHMPPIAPPTAAERILNEDDQTF